MNALLAMLPVIVGAVGFQASLGYEPALMGKDYLLNEPQVLLLPYSGYYLNNRISGKCGIGFASGWEMRAVGGFARTYLFDGNAPFGVHDWYPSWQFCEWKSYEFSGGAEIGRALRFRTGMGDLFLGAECVWGHYWFEGLFLDFSATNTEDYFNTARASANGLGWQCYSGINYPVMKINSRSSLNFTGMLKTGRVHLSPASLPQGGVWGSWSYPDGNVDLPRWGLALGLTLVFDTRDNLGVERLVDLRMKPVPTRGCFLAGIVDTLGCCIGGCCLTGTYSREAQAATAFLLGPGVGIPFGLVGAAMMFDNDASSEIVPLALGCYLWSPVASYIGTMLGGRMFNPGGSRAYTFLGTLLGQVANLALAEGYRMAVGANPWRGDGDMSAMMRGPKKGTYVVISVASTLPTIGALVGYNLSLRHAREMAPDTMGFEPSWSEKASLVLSDKPEPDEPPELNLSLLTLAF